jgi:hypothetical protein
MKRILPVLLMLALAVAGYTGTGQAGIAKESKERFKVTHYLTIQYDFNYCQDQWALYKMNTVSRRWHRDTKKRVVRRVHGAYGTSSNKCNGDIFQRRKEFDFKPCFGCDGARANWTPDIAGHPGYPYLMSTGSVALLGAHMRTYVGTKGGKFLGSVCVKNELFGKVNCYPE